MMLTVPYIVSNFLNLTNLKIGHNVWDTLNMWTTLMAGGPRNVPIKDTLYRAAVHIFHFTPSLTILRGKRAKIPVKRVKEGRFFIRHSLLQ